MTQMRDSTLDPRWLAEQMRLNPPKKLDNGNIFSGPVRLAFPNVFKPREAKAGNPASESSAGKFGATVLFPLGTDFRIFAEEWTRAAREAFPKNWTPDGKPMGLHSPFHDQAEKTVGVKPLTGFTPGAIYMNVSSQYKPQVVDGNMNLIIDESRVYAGVWAFLSLNVYKYVNLKTGIGFGLQSVMIIADDTKLAGSGSDPRQDFAGITITAQSNVAEKFNNAPVLGQTAPASIMPTGGFVGATGPLPTQPLPVDVNDLY
jgi:hypothetical protein